MVFFGQLVIGPPGAGKSTFCNGMQQLCVAIKRPCVVINLDPSNDTTPYTCAVDIRKLTTVEEVMSTTRLGPNGALMFCMEFLHENFDWLQAELQKPDNVDKYLIFDCPGQVELYTHHGGILGIIELLQKNLNARLTAVHLIDSIMCTEPVKYISALLVSLSGQLRLALPHVNVLSKIDLLGQHQNELAFRLEYYSEVQDLHHLLTNMEQSQLTSHHPFDVKFRKLNRELCELIGDFNLVSFVPVYIEDPKSVLRALAQIDSANGFNMCQYVEDVGDLFKLISPPSVGFTEEAYGTLQERYVDNEIEGAELPADQMK